MDTRVVIFEDNKLMRNGFEAICNGTPVITCCGVLPTAMILTSK